MDIPFTFLLWLQALLPLFILAIAFYVLIIKPLEKHRSVIRWIQNLCPGMRVMTHEGRAGVVIIVLKSTIIVAFDDGTKVEILKQNAKSEAS